MKKVDHDHDDFQVLGTCVFTDSFIKYAQRQGRCMTSGKLVPEMYTPLHHFYKVKLWFAGLYLFFSFFIQNIDSGYSLELPRQHRSDVYPQFMF